MSSKKTQQQQKALLFGSDHSPWTQVVMLALEHKKIPYDLTYTLNKEMFQTNGHLMPTIQYKNVTMGGSMLILKFLDEQHPENPIFCEDDPDWLKTLGYHSEVEELCIEFLMERFFPIHYKIFLYPYLVCQTRSKIDGFWNKIYDRIWLGIFCAFHGFGLLCFNLFTFLLKRPETVDSNRLEKLLKHWENRLPEDSHKFFGGAERLTYMDLVLYSHLQIPFCGLQDSCVSVITQRPKLLNFITKMNGIFKDYKSNYCLRVMPDGLLVDAITAEKAPFWLSLISMFVTFVMMTVLLPVQVGISFYFKWSVRTFFFNFLNVF